MSDVQSRPGARREHPRGVPYERVLATMLRDPEFRRAYEELEPEFQVIRQVIALRNKRNMTQTELAKRVGTKQSSIARMETKGQLGTLGLLHRVAKALDAQLDVRLIPCEEVKRSTRKKKSAPGSDKSARAAPSRVKAKSTRSV